MIVSLATFAAVWSSWQQRPRVTIEHLLPALLRAGIRLRAAILAEDHDLTFRHLARRAGSRATLGVYEMTRVELLRDLFVWAYERSTQVYLAIKQDLAEPDPLRLAWRNVIKQSLREVITHPENDPISSIQRSVAERVPAPEQADVQALIIEELRRLHGGVLARYGLWPSEYAAWKVVQGH